MLMHLSFNPHFRIKLTSIFCTNNTVPTGKEYNVLAPLVKNTIPSDVAF
jgi:hypothetical protein